MRRVVATGIGVVSAIGRNAPDFWTSLRTGACGIRPVTGGYRGAQLRFPTAAQVADFNPAQHFDPKQADYLDRFAQLGLVAAREAVRDAGISFTPELAANTLIATGSSLGGKYIEDDGYFHMYAEGAQRFPQAVIGTNSVRR